MTGVTTNSRAKSIIGLSPVPGEAKGRMNFEHWLNSLTNVHRASAFLGFSAPFRGFNGHGSRRCSVLHKHQHRLPLSNARQCRLATFGRRGLPGNKGFNLMRFLLASTGLGALVRARGSACGQTMISTAVTTPQRPDCRQPYPDQLARVR